VEWIHLGQSYGRTTSCPERPNRHLDSIFLGLLSDYELLNSNATARSQLFGKTTFPICTSRFVLYFVVVSPSRLVGGFKNFGETYRVLLEG
jgi:hypothetical protein